MTGPALSLALMVAFSDAGAPSTTTPPEHTREPALAPETDGSPSSSDATIHDPRACPALFGDDEARAGIARFRTRAVGEISVQNNLVTIVHSVAAWREVTVHRRRGLAVASIERVHVKAPSGAVHDELVALVDVTEQAMPKGGDCVPGLYALTADDTIGERGFVVLVDPRGVLVELDGQLGWLAGPTQRAPRSRLVWRSSFDSAVDEPLVAKRTGKSPLAVRTFRRM
jgi:hypothetical protein